jgi:hypothetical protein
MENRPPRKDQGLFNRSKSESEGLKHRNRGARRIIPDNMAVFVAQFWPRREDDAKIKNFYDYGVFPYL